MDNNIPRDPAAVVLKDGRLLCPECVEKTPEVLDDDQNVIVVNSDDWKHEVLGAPCRDCGETVS